MPRPLRTATVLLALLAAPGVALATTIDFEAFADAQNLHGVNLGGVTVTNPVSMNVEIFDNRFGVAFHSATKAIGSFATPTASSFNPMVFTFDVAQTMVSLWGGDAGNDTDSWTLNAYDAAVGGNLVDFAFSGLFDGNPYVQLLVSAPTIWRVEAVWNGPDCCGVGYDDLTFDVDAVDPIPEPATLLLLGLGLTGLGLRRRNAPRD